MTARRAPCWLLTDGQGNYALDWYKEEPIHYPSETEARRVAEKQIPDMSPVRRETVCADTPECAECGARFDDDPGVHYLSHEDALDEAEEWWHRIGDRVWCNECEHEAPEVLEETARREAEQMHDPIFTREEVISLER